jgi:hypothetical protein
MWNLHVTKIEFSRELTALSTNIDTVADRIATPYALMAESNRLTKEEYRLTHD